MPDFVLPPQNTASPFADMHGHHVAVRAPSLEEAKDFYIGKLDFRVVPKSVRIRTWGTPCGTPATTTSASTLTVSMTRWPSFANEA